MKKRILIGSIVTVAIIATAVCILPYSKKIDQTIQSVQWDVQDKEKSENIKVTVKGRYNRYLFRENSFKGDIYVEGYDFTYNAEPVEVKFTDRYGWLIYHDKEQILKSNQLGFLSCDDDFKEILIGVFTPVDSDKKGWGEEVGTLTISGSATNRDEAQEVAKRLAEKSESFPYKNIFN